MIIKQYRDLKPIFLRNDDGSWVNTKEFVVSRTGWSNLPEAYDLIADSTIEPEGRSIRGMSVRKGIITVRNSNNIIAIICENSRNELVAFIGQEYVTSSPTHLPYIKHGIYKAGVKRGKFELKSQAELALMFTGTISLSLEDVLPEGQLANSKAFILEERVRLNPPTIPAPSIATVVPQNAPTFEELFSIIEEEPKVITARTRSEEAADRINEIVRTFGPTAVISSTRIINTTSTSTSTENPEDAEFLERLDQELRSIYGM